jgi:hypothetical protein
VLLRKAKSIIFGSVSNAPLIIGIYGSDVYMLIESIARREGTMARLISTFSTL